MKSYLDIKKKQISINKLRDVEMFFEELDNLGKFYEDVENDIIPLKTYPKNKSNLNFFQKKFSHSPTKQDERYDNKKQKFYKDYEKDKYQNRYQSYNSYGRNQNSGYRRNDYQHSQNDTHNRNYSQNWRQNDRSENNRNRSSNQNFNSARTSEQQTADTIQNASLNN